MLLFIDCETRSVLTLQKVGTDVYSRNCQLLMVAYALNDEPPNLWLPSESDIPPELISRITDPTITKVAWNSSFERSIFHHQLQLNIPVEQWLDPSIYARYMGLPSGLQLASDYLKLGDKAKDKEGRRLIQKFSKPYTSRN